MSDLFAGKLWNEPKHSLIKIGNTECIVSLLFNFESTQITLNKIANTECLLKSLVNYQTRPKIYQVG